MKNKILLGVCSAAALALASSAFATDAIRYSLNGGSWVTVQDNAAGDADSSIGGINISISAGGFIVTLSSQGFSAGTPGSPIVDLNVGGHFQSPGGSLVVEYTSTDYHPVPAGSYILQNGGHVSGGVTVNNYGFLGQNTQFAGTDPVAPSNPFVAPSVTGGGSIGPLAGFGTVTHSAFVGQADPYSITLVEAITVPNGSGTISDDLAISVPDGGNTLMMLGSALSVLGLGVFRRKAVKA